jgi:Tfp pilus assembly protein PilO
MSAGLRELAARVPTPRLALEVLAWRYGRIWVVSVLIAALAANVWIFINRPLQAKLADAREERLALQAELDRLSTVGAVASADAPSIISVESVLPSASDLDAHVDDIYQAAQRHKLQFSRSTLRTADNVKSRTSRTEITLPVRGTYPAIAQFLETLLREQPHLSVDQLEFRRDSIGASEGDAEIRISCWSLLPALMHAPSAPRTAGARGTRRE